MPRHYPNQCCVIVNSILRNKLQKNCSQILNFITQENAVENVFCKMAPSLSGEDDLRQLIVNYTFCKNPSVRQQKTIEMICYLETPGIISFHFPFSNRSFLLRTSYDNLLKLRNGHHGHRKYHTPRTEYISLIKVSSSIFCRFDEIVRRRGISNKPTRKLSAFTSLMCFEFTNR